MHKKKRTITTERYIELVSQDYQFNPKHPDYLGYINIDPRDGFDLGGVDCSEVAIKIAMNPDSFERIANKYGLSIESACETELIFVELNN